MAAARAANNQGLQGMVEQLQEEIITLRAQQSTRSVKVRPPEPFDGTRNKLRAFATQLDLYLRLNRERITEENDKVLFASTYLTGPAFDWFEPILRDYQENQPDRQDDNTQAIFASYAEFKKQLEGTFGDIDATRNAERKLWRLRQHGSASKLVSEFQQIISHLDWDEDAYIAKFEEILKPEIQEKLIWMERPSSLSELFSRAVRIDNTLYDLHSRKKDKGSWNTFRGNPRMNRYQSNDKRPAQPRNLGYEDPYGPRPMELDATQQRRPFVSEKERERRRNDKLCFTCGRPGHMSRDCRQRQNARTQQQSNQRRTISATQERGAHDTTGTVMPELRATDDDETWHMAQEEHGGPEESYRRIRARKSANQLRKLMKEESTLSDEEINEIAESSEEDYWPNEWTVGSNRGYDKAHVRMDGSEKAIDTNEPDLEGSPGNRHDEVHKVIDPLDEEYGTQWEGHDPNMEEPHELPETPQTGNPSENEYENETRNLAKENEEKEKSYTRSGVYSPLSNASLWSRSYSEQREKDNETNEDIAAYFIDDVVLSIKENPKRLSSGFRKLLHTLGHYCPHWKLKCWEQENETWREHLQHCEHLNECPICGKDNTEYHVALHEVSKRMPDSRFYQRGIGHKDIPWIACHHDKCVWHEDQKNMASYYPQKPKCFDTTCPCWDPNCSCIGYRRHRFHDIMHWTACYQDDCWKHDKPYYPQPRGRKPNWKANLSATQRGYHLKFEGQVLNQSAKVMIDSGATGNYMNPTFKERLKILGIKKATPEPISGLNGENLGSHLTDESGFVPMAVMGHLESINFDVTPLGQYDVVLGIPWLRNHNPTIKWKTGEIEFNECECPRKQTTGSRRGLDTFPRSTDGRADSYVKRSRGGSKKKSKKDSTGCDPKRHETSDTATNIVLAATRASERHWLTELSGWAPDTNEEYQTYSIIEDIPKSPTSEGYHSQDESADHDLDSWELVDHKDLAATEQKAIPAEYEEFRHLFKRPEQIELPEYGPHDHKIPLMEGKEPTCKKIYAMSETESKALKEYIDEQLRKGTIRPSKSPAGHGVLFVPKKDKGLRLCMDYRPLNAITIKDRHPLPRIDEMQDRIKGAKWFTKLDITDAYYRLRINKGEEWKTAFRTKYGHYEYLVMPFGLTNAPASFQRFVNEALGEHLDIFVIAYLDDILIFSNEYEEHVRHVKAVLKKLEQAALRLKESKCELHVQETEFLGHWITTKGIEMEKSKVKAILDWPTPKNVKEVQQFAGLINYYRRFIQDYSRTMTPLFEITKKGKEFQWGPEQQKAFEKAKEKITSAPILVQFDPEKETTIETDASDYAIGMRMTQPGLEGKPQAVAFHSRKLVPAEVNYDIHDKELLAIVVAFKTWRVYLEGARHTVLVKTDHKNLTFFTTTKELTRRQARWAEVLSQYDFKIIHCKGNENGQADALSRRPDYEIKERTPNPAILKANEDGSIGYNQQILAATFHINDKTLEKRIIEETKEDDIIQDMIEDPTNSDKITEKEGLVYMRNLIYIPKCMRNEIIAMHHDPPLYGHPGTDRTTELVARNYYFPNLRKTVQQYTRSCETCKRDKPARHQPWGKMQSPDAPEHPWEWITVDFITQLPVSQGYDSIAVFTDRLTKYIHIEPAKGTMTATEMAWLFLKVIITNHGIPKQITSDRDKLFTSKFWNTLTKLLGVDHRLTTAYRPQANGQTERVNQTIEQYLRHYVNYEQNDWITFLPMAQFAYNNTEHSTTKETPFYANYGYNPTLMGEKRKNESKSDEAVKAAEKLKNIHKQLSRDIEFMNAKSAIYYNQGHADGPTFERGEKVYLVRKNIRTKRPSQKLDHQKIGPFAIEERTGPVNYRLRLPESMKRLHPVFHISLLEPASQNAQLAENIEIESDDEYEVERILNDKRVSGRPFYLVKWKGYGTSENTWEPIAHLAGCHDKVTQYHRGKNRSPPKKKENLSGSD